MITNSITTYFLKKKKGTTLLEIMTALIILAFTFIPIIASIGTSTQDTEVQNSYVFAQTTARNILDTLLDDVPFGCIKEGSSNIMEFTTSPYYPKYDLTPFKKMILGPEKYSGNKADGTIEDDRGVKYDIKLYVWNIPANDKVTHQTDKEMIFSYLPRPEYETASTTDASTGAINNTWYTYDDSSSGAGMYIQNKMNPYKDYPVSRIDKNAFELGAKTYDGSGCSVMKRILLKIEWVARDKKKRSMEIYTMKANLDSENVIKR